MNVLITGAGGQLGRALVQTSPTHAHVTAYAHAKLDVSDPHAIRSCVQRHRPDVIVNAAAYTAVDQAESEPLLAQRINADAPRYLAEVARSINARLIHISTNFVFDGTAGVPYRPDAATNPLSVYGATKRAGEIAVVETLPGSSVVLRTAWVYAAKGRNFVNTMLRMMREHGCVRVVADQIGTPTSARSLAHALWRIADAPYIEGVHHWTDAGVASWYDFAVAIAEEGATLGLLSVDVAVNPTTTDEYVTPARRPHYGVLDATALQGIASSVHWRKCLRLVLEEITSA